MFAQVCRDAAGHNCFDRFRGYERLRRACIRQSHGDLTYRGVRTAVCSYLGCKGYVVDRDDAAVISGPCSGSPRVKVNEQVLDEQGYGRLSWRAT